MFVRIASLLFCVCYCQYASADVVFSLTPVGPTTVTPGTSVTINLVATDPDGNELGTQFWEGFNAVVTATTADPNDAPAASVLPGFNFNVSNTDPFNGATGRTLGALAFPPVLSSDGDILASFTYIADVAGTTDFAFNLTGGFNTADLSTLATGGSPDTLELNTGGQLFGTSITVTAIPEPSSFAFIACGIGGLIYRRRRVKALLVA